MGNAKSTPLSPPCSSFPRVQTTGFETSPLKRDRCLKHLLRLNHINHSVLFSRLRFHNHVPHSLGSAYLLGAPPEQLNALYDEEAKVLESWKDAPGEVARRDWREHISEREYQRAYLDFFEDELVRLGYDWKRVVAEYLFVGPEPLIFGGIGGLGHPLIHLGYAFELESKDIAMEALTLFATNYNFLHQYIDDEYPTPSTGPPVDKSPPPPANATSSPEEILRMIHDDPTFDDLFESPGADNIEPLFAEKSAQVLAYYHQLLVTDVDETHKLLNRVSALLLTCTHEPGRPEYDFFVVHLTTVGYAVRTLLPEVPGEYAVPLVKMHWLFIILVYIIQLRRKVRPELLDGVDVEGKGWGDVVQKALGGHKEGTRDAHYLKAARALKDSAALWEDQDEFYLKAAVKFAWEFEEWSFGGDYEN